MKAQQVKKWLSIIAIILCLAVTASPFLFKEIGFKHFFFLITAISLIVLTAIYFLKEIANLVPNETEYVYKYVKIGVFLLILIYYSFAWPVVVNRYFTPDDSKFSNADYHYIRHTGFCADDSIVLLNSERNNSALLETNDGYAMILKDTGNLVRITTANLTVPFFYAIESHKETIFLNPYFNHTIKNNFSVNDGVMNFSLAIDRKSKFRTDYIFTINNRSYTALFNKPLSSGFTNIKEILKTTSISDQILDSLSWLDGCMLIKNDYNFDKNESAGKNTTFHLFPSPLLQSLFAIGSNGIRIDDNIPLRILRQQENNIISKEIFFRTGWNLDGDPLYKLSLKNRKIDLSIERPYHIFRLPKASNLPNQVNVNITSQNNFSTWKSNSVLYKKIFESENHDLHINSVFSFISDKAGIAVSPVSLLDFNSGDTLRIEDISLGKDFLVSAHKNTKSQSGFYWKYQLDNFATNNPISKSWVILFPTWFFICFFIYILLNYRKKYFCFSGIEALIHLSLLILLSLKLWMLWRMNAFPPTIAESSARVTGIGPMLGLSFLSTEKFALFIPPLIFLFLSLANKLRYINKVRINIQKISLKISLVPKWFPGIILIALFILMTWLKWRSNDMYVSFFTVAVILFYISVIILSNRNLISASWKWFLLIFFTFALALVETGLSVIIAHGLACYFIFYFCTRRQSISKKIWLIQLLLFGACLLFLVPAINRSLWNVMITVSNYLGKSENTKYRATILSQSPETAYLETSFDKTEVTRYFNAYDNIQFIEYYSHQKPESLAGLFTLQTHKQTAVKFKDQASDLVLSRYVIAEHGQLLAAILLILLFIPLGSLFYYALRRDDFRDQKPYVDASIFAASLLFMWSYYIFACNMNILPFVGQDFPFISLTSYTTYLVPTVLIFTIIFFYNYKLQPDEAN